MENKEMYYVAHRTTMIQVTLIPLKHWFYVKLSTQDCVLFHDTIFHNLHYGDLTKPQEKVYEASKMAELHESVQTWPKVRH